MSPTPYAADLVVPIAWGLVGLLLAVLAYALLRGHRRSTAPTAAVPEVDATADAAIDRAPDPAGPTTGPTAGPTAPTRVPPLVDTAAPAPDPITPASAWDQGQPAPEPTADARQMRVLRRQVDVLTRTLAEWDQVRVAEAGEPPASTPPEAVAPTPTPPAPFGPVARPSLPGAAYLDLSRRLAERGDLDGAVLAQWACDLEVLRGPLAGHEGDLATAVAAVDGDDPAVVLRGCREAALALVAVAGPVRTLLAPLDHLVQAAADPAKRVPSAGFPAELVELAPEADRPALSALVAGQQS